MKHIYTHDAQVYPMVHTQCFSQASCSKRNAELRLGGVKKTQWNYLQIRKSSIAASSPLGQNRQRNRAASRMCKTELGIEGH